MTSAMESDARPTKRLCVMEVEFGNYDVFISHRGPDTKMGFVGFLYDALRRAGLHPFLDCTSICKGQDAWKCIDQAIQTTPLALVIFSESFAQSEWCLKELHAMLDSPSMKVFPIFYKVQPWEVSFPEKGQLAMGFAKLKERHDKTLVDEWRVNMQIASKLSGWEYRVGDQRLEKDLVVEVVGKVFELANKPLPLDVGDHIVGVKQVAENLIQIVVEKKVLMLGLWGMGGIGKSTLARELYNQLGRRFDARCYVEDVAEKVCGSLLRDEEDVKIWKEVLKKLKCGTIMDEKTIFECLRISYDALPEQYQEMFLDIACALLGASVEMAKLAWRSQGWSGALGVRTLVEKALIRVDEFGAFGMHDHLRDMGRAIVKQERSKMGICKRLWGSESLALLNKNEPLRDSLQTLMLFGNLKIQIDLTLMKGLRILRCETCLLSMSSFPENLLWLDYIRSGHEPLGHFPEVLENNELVILFWRSGSMERLPESFGDLKKLEVLNLTNCSKLIRLPNSFGSLQNLKNLALGGSGIQRLPESFGMLNNLEVLNLQVCSNLVELPSSFGGLQNLNHLDLAYNGIQSLPDSFGTLSNLEVLNLRACYRLVELPDLFGGLQNLKNLDLTFNEIQSLPESFGTLCNLEMLNLGVCSNLVELPSSFGGLQNLKNLDLEGSGIQNLPKSFGKLSNLEVLNLRTCYGLMELPNLFGGLQNLNHLDLAFNGIQSLPESFGTLSNLEVLNLRACYRLVELPDLFRGLQNLKNLDLEGSGIQNLPESFGTLSNLEVLNLQACYGLVELPNFFGGLQSLNHLNLSYNEIQSLPESFGTLSNLKVLNLRACFRLVELPDLFGGLKNLNYVDLTYSGIQSLPESFGMLNNLKVLN